MRQMTLNNALKEQNVWFRVTPEQASQLKTLTHNLDYSPEIVETISDVIALGISSNSTRIGFCFYEEAFNKFIENIVIQHSLEQIQIIDEVPFKTQKEVWEFLVSNEGNVIEHIRDNSEYSLIDGMLYNIADNQKVTLALYIPNAWKPSTKLYHLKQKEWWELNGNKPTLCWYGDDLKNNGKPRYIGVCQRCGDKFVEVFPAITYCFKSLTWTYAIPLTREEIEEFIFKPLENG